MDEKIKDALLFPILKAVINEVKPPSSSCIMHHLQIGKRTLYFNDDDILFLYQILENMVNTMDKRKESNKN